MENWSIYAYVPFVWLVVVLVVGLIRAAYEVGLESGPEIETLRVKVTLTDLEIYTSTLKPAFIFNQVKEEMAVELFQELKNKIMFWVDRDHPRRLRTISGSIGVIK